MEDKYYKKYLKYKHKYAALKNAFSNDMYAQFGGNPPNNPFYQPPPTLSAKVSPPAKPTTAKPATTASAAPPIKSLTPEEAAQERLKSRPYEEVGPPTQIVYTQVAPPSLPRNNLYGTPLPPKKQ